MNYIRCNFVVRQNGNKITLYNRHTDSLKVLCVWNGTENAFSIYLTRT